MTTPPPPRPLDGVKVVELANLLATPMAGMFLADLGADVIKVERPGSGDEVRHWGENKDGVGLYYKVINRGKRSITLDLHTPFGVETVKRLVADADIVTESFRTGTLEKWGLGYDVLSQVNPAIVMARVTGFGQTGPKSRRPGFGTLAEAYSGLAYITGEPDRPPLLPAFGLGDASTGLMVAFLVTAALHESRRSGQGQQIDLALYETLFTLLGPQVINYDQLGLIQERLGSRLPFTAPRNSFRTRDGEYIAISGSAQSTFERICAALGIPELLEDPRFANNRDRLVHAVALDDALQAAIGSYDRDELIDIFVSLDATAIPVNSVADVMADDQVIARENVVAIDDEELGGPVRMQAPVGKLSRTPGVITHAGPRLGEHNREVLVDQLGYTPEQLAAEGIDLDPEA